MSTLLIYAPAPGHSRPHHPENYARLSGLLSFFEEYHVISDLTMREAQPARMSQLTRVHSSALIEEIKAASVTGPGLLDPDTYVTAESYEFAALAAGGCAVAIDGIYSGVAGNGMALVRPPGHHASQGQVGGFCLLNNVAIAARHAQSEHGARRVLIVDFDVHHGNGTQDIFYNDESVLYISLHLYHPFFYPGTGSINERGEGPGFQTTVNIPFPPHVGDTGYRRAFAEIVSPCARRFKPELLLVSAGFDAHWQDPLARASLSLTGYAHIARALVALADELCEGRILFVLEGGYFPEALQCGLLNTVFALLGRDRIVDPLGQAPSEEANVTNLLDAIGNLHLQV